MSERDVHRQPFKYLKFILPLLEGRGGGGDGRNNRRKISRSLSFEPNRVDSQRE